jgi:RNA polymerase sigma factor (TIGR02999 family)
VVHTLLPATTKKTCHDSQEIFVLDSPAMMDEPGSPEISILLANWGRGDEEALNRLVSAVYPEMRRIARQYLGPGSGGHTMQSAALANEAYLKLVRARGIHCEDRVHFFALCAQIIRRILVDHARERGRAKRGGNAIQVSFDEALLGTRAHGVDVLDLDRALGALSEIDNRKGRVVELRFFGGLSVDETADVLHVSPETVARDWKIARTWLFRELNAK